MRYINGSLYPACRPFTRHAAGVPRGVLRVGAWVGSASMRIDRLPSQESCDPAICLPYRGRGTEISLGDGFAGTFSFACYIMMGLYVSRF